MGLEIIDGIRSQEPEDGNVHLLLLTGGRQEGVVPAGEIDAVGPAAPEGEAVGGHLVPADAGGLHAVFLPGIADGDAVHDPGTDIGRVFAEDGVEIRHIGVHDLLPVLGGVAQAVGAVHPVVVLDLHTGIVEGHTGLPAQGFGDLPPDAQLVIFIQVFPEKVLIPRLHQGVVFQRVGPGEAILLHQDQDPAQGIEIIRQEPAGFRVGHADKIVDMNDRSLFHGNCSFPCCVHPTRKPAKCQFTERYKHPSSIWQKYRTKNAQRHMRHCAFAGIENRSQPMELPGLWMWVLLSCSRVCS